MFDKILIANRGEIAVRIMKTARRLGIKTVAIYSKADRNSQHTLFADEAYCVGEAPSRDSYLQIDRIISTAKISGAQAIHPGYGFLSENMHFAKACSDNELIFIGPSCDALTAMGSKQTAKQLLEKAQVPLIPGYHGEEQSPNELLKQARDIGFPVLLKAALGGGGKGMRLVNAENEFSEAFNSAKREAQASFGDDTLLIEKYLANPRHVEIQVFADNHDNAVYLFERDCSIQRRHQKIIEEAPAPDISPVLRQRMGEAALNVVKTIHYTGAGTIEFLVDGEDFYFMEMNTRLQVEHPVTEFITNTDLVEWQLRVANNEKLPLSQQQLTCTGHAIEVRIYAEDPANDFMPSIGKITTLMEPVPCHWLRIDSGVMQGDEISMHYDPMIAKLIVHGATRDQAIQRLIHALSQYHVTGIKTNRQYLQSILKCDAFKQAKLSTHFLSEQQLIAPLPLPIEAPLIASLYDYLKDYQQVSTNALLKEAYNWQSLVTTARQFSYYDDNQEVIQISLQQTQSGQFSIHCKNQELIISAHLEDQNLLVEWQQQLLQFTLVDERNGLTICYQDAEYQVERFDTSLQYSNQQAKDGQLTAPMPGTVVAVLTSPGQSVSAGESLIVIEAMKMEHTIHAPIPGSIGDVFYQVGDQVNEGDELVTIEAS